MAANAGPTYLAFENQILTSPAAIHTPACRCELAAPADLPALLRIWAAGMQQAYPALPLTAEHRRRFRRNFRQQRAPFGFLVARGAAGEVLG